MRLCLNGDKRKIYTRRKPFELHYKFHHSVDSWLYKRNHFDLLLWLVFTYLLISRRGVFISVLVTLSVSWFKYRNFSIKQVIERRKEEWRWMRKATVAYFRNYYSVCLHRRRTTTPTSLLTHSVVYLDYFLIIQIQNSRKGKIYIRQFIGLMSGIRLSIYDILFSRWSKWAFITFWAMTPSTYVCIIVSKERIIEIFIQSCYFSHSYCPELQITDETWLGSVCSPFPIIFINSAGVIWVKNSKWGQIGTPSLLEWWY